jgi:urease accessory protein
MLTSERSGVACTLLEVDADPSGGRCVVRTSMNAAEGASVLRPMLLASGPGQATIALVPEGAMLLTGDRIEVRCRVGAGVTLTVVEPSGTVAYDMRGGTASWDVSLDVADGATLVWQGQPFVAAAGARVDRRTDLTLGRDAGLLLRETLVLGRGGAGAGTIRSTTRVVADGKTVLAEDLELSTATQVPGLLGRHRVLDSILVLGRPVPEQGAPLALERGGFLYRDLADATHASRLNGLWSALSRPGSDRSSGPERASAPPRG